MHNLNIHTPLCPHGGTIGYFLNEGIKKCLHKGSIASIRNLSGGCSRLAGVMVGDVALVTRFLMVKRIVKSQNGRVSVSLLNSSGKMCKFS